MSAPAFGRHWFFTSWLLLASALALEAGWPGFSGRFRAAPFLLSIVLFGLPHGAADLMLLRTHLAGAGIRALVSRFGRYLLVMALAATLLLAVPRWTLLGFLVLSAWHFGLSDVHDLRLLGFQETSRLRSRLRAAARGLLILSLPLAMSPVATAQVANEILDLLGRPPLGGTLPVPVQGIARGAAIAAVAGSAALVLVRFARGHVRLGAIETVETGLILAVVSWLHPLFAIGTYFLACHSLRHFAKLAAVWRSGSHESSLRLILRVYAKAAPLLLPTLAVLGLLGATLAAWRPESLVAALLIVFIVTTLSHHLLVDDVIDLEGTPAPSPGRTVPP